MNPIAIITQMMSNHYQLIHTIYYLMHSNHNVVTTSHRSSTKAIFSCDCCCSMNIGEKMYNYKNLPNHV